MTTKEQTESELARIFIDYFENDGFEVFPEVPLPWAGVIDFVAHHNGLIIAVEVKTQLSFKVIEQAVRNKGHAHLSYVAVPLNRTSQHFQVRVCREFGIGVLFYDERCRTRDLVIERANPQFNRKITAPALHEYMKKSTAGSKHDRITPFRNTINEIVEHLRASDGQDAKELLERINHHYAHTQAAKANLKKWIKEGVVKEFVFLNGRFYLNESLPPKGGDVLESLTGE